MAERDDQLAQERTGPGLAVDERRVAQRADRADDRRKCAPGLIEVFDGGGMIEQIRVKALQVVTRRRAVTSDKLTHATTSVPSLWPCPASDQARREPDRS